MELNKVTIKLEKSKIKAGDGKKSGNYPLYTCSPVVNKYSDEFLYDTEAIIIGTGGNPVINYCNGKFAYSTDCLAIKTNDEIKEKYMYYYLISKIDKINKMFRGAGLKHLNKNEFFKLEIKNAPIEEQEKVIDELDNIQSIIDIRKKQIQQLDELIKSQFVELFENNNEWNEVTLNDVSDKITDGEHGTVPRVESGKLYLMARNITESNKIDLTEISYIPEENHKKIYSRCNPEKGDLLLVCVGATIGKVALVPDMEEFSMARSVALIKPNKSLMNSLFLLYLIKSDYVQAQIKNCIHAAAQAGLYTNMVKNLKFRLPPNELQKKFAEFVEKVDKQKFEIEKSLKEMETLYESLMNKYFG